MMKKLENYFFDEEESDVKEAYKFLGKVAIVSLIATLLLLLKEEIWKKDIKKRLTSTPANKSLVNKIND